MVETNLVETGRQRLEANLTISKETQDILESFHDAVSAQVDLAVQSLVTNNQPQAQEVINAKPEISTLATEAESHLSRRLSADEPNRMVTFHLESEMIEYLKRMYYFAKRIAKIVESNPSSKTMQAPGQTK